MSIYILQFINLLKETIVRGKFPSLSEAEKKAVTYHGRVTNTILEEKVVEWPKTDTIIITYVTENVAQDLVKHVDYIIDNMPFDYEVKIFFHGFFKVEGDLVLRYGGQFASPFQGKLYDPSTIETFVNEINQQTDSSIIDQWFDTYLEAMHDGENHSNMQPARITNIGIFLRKLPNIE